MIKKLWVQVDSS